MKSLPGYSPDALIGRTFVRKVGDEQIRSRVTKKIIERSDDPDIGDKISFMVEAERLSQNEMREEIISYNDVLNYLDKLAVNDLGSDQQTWKFRDVTAHQGPLKSVDAAFNGSKYNVLVE